MARVFIGQEIKPGDETIQPNLPDQHTYYITPVNSDFVSDQKQIIDNILISNGYTDKAEFYLAKHGIKEDVWGGN